MHATEILERLGGVGDWSTLVALCGDTHLRGLVDSGDVVRVARGRYSLPRTAEDLRVAHSVTGRLCLRSAALHHGWEVARVPTVPDVTVPHKRHLSERQRSRATFRFVDLPAEDVRDGVTVPRRTIVDCIQHLPPDEALAIADSALRHRAVSPAGLVDIAARASGRGSRQARRVAAIATADAANPFESVLRHLALSVEGLDVRPQVTVHDRDGGFLARPDLVDRMNRIVVEADSFAHHGTRGALRHDCRRYTDLAVHGWMVLRFTWEDVMHRPEYVLDRLRRAVAQASPSGCSLPPDGQASRRPHWLAPPDAGRWGA